MGGLVKIFQKLDYFGGYKRIAGIALLAAGGAIGGAVNALAGVDILVPGSEALLATAGYMDTLGKWTLFVGIGSAAARPS